MNYKKIKKWVNRKSLYFWEWLSWHHWYFWLLVGLPLLIYLCVLDDIRIDRLKNWDKFVVESGCRLSRVDVRDAGIVERIRAFVRQYTAKDEHWEVWACDDGKDYERRVK